MSFQYIRLYQTQHADTSNLLIIFGFGVSSVYLILLFSVKYRESLSVFCCNSGSQGRNQTPDFMDKSRIQLFIKAAKRVLIQVKDFCVRTLYDCSTQLDYSAVLSCPASRVPSTLPYSFNASSTKSSGRRENHNGISRAASTKSFAGERQRLRKSPTAVGVLPRSYSVGLGKIDEEKTLEFEEEEAVVAGVYTRGRSLAVYRTRQIF